METTSKIQDWMKNLDDSDKLRFVINWKIPHSLFNVASKLYKGDKSDLQKANWFTIFRERKMGVWKNGGHKVSCN